MNTRITSALALAASMALFASVPAHATAMAIPTTDSWLAISPCDSDCLEAEILDPLTGASVDTMQATVMASFSFVADAAEVDSEASIAYFLAAGEIYAYDLTSDDVVEMVASGADFPSDSPSLRGLAIDDQTGMLQVLWYDDNASHYFLTAVDTVTGDVDQTGLQLDDYLLGDDGSDVAISGDRIYVLVSDEIVILDSVDGALIGTEGLPEANLSDNAIDTDVSGNLRLVLRDNQDFLNHFYTYDLASDAWSAPVTTVREEEAFAWWERPGDDVPANLAETGFDSTGLIAGSAAFVAVGGALVLRRRAQKRP